MKTVGKHRKIFIGAAITIVIILAWAPWMDNQKIHDQIFAERAQIDGTIDRHTGQLLCDYKVMWVPFGRLAASCEGGYLISFWGKVF